MNISSEITARQDKDGMLRRALERIIQLYTDKSHFIYELLQNAEDAGAQNIKFIQHAECLEVLHDGIPFTIENLQGLCDIGKSDKVDNLNQIGEFGVGFKSVFGICDTVKLFSTPDNYKGEFEGTCSPFAVEIRDFTRPVDIPYSAVAHGYTTRFEFPFCVGFSFSGFKTVKLLNDALSSRLQNLGITTLLFMRNLESIEYEILTTGQAISGCYLLDKQEINDHCSLISAIGETGASEESLSYLKFTKPIEDGITLRTVDIAYPVTVSKDGQYEFKEAESPYISVYFPTETESKLKFIIQGPYRTTPNRSSVPSDEPENIRLAQMTAELLTESILELRDQSRIDLSFLKMLPTSSDDFRTYDLFEPLYDAVIDMFSSEEIIPCKSGVYITAENAKIARSQALADLFDDRLLSDLIGEHHTYRWLPTVLTETSKQFKGIYEFFTDELGIDVVRPEDLREYFNSNKTFLPARDDEWLTKMYSMYEAIPNIFSKSRYGSSNMLLACFVKTDDGSFAAPYRKDSDGNYLQNIFLPSKKTYSISGISFINRDIYNRCQTFFRETLQLQAPKEYDLFVKEYKKHCSEADSVSDAEHISDIKNVLVYLKSSDYGNDMASTIRTCLLLRCRYQGSVINVNPYKTKVMFPMTRSNISIEAYYQNVFEQRFVDLDYYLGRDVSYEDLSQLGVSDKILLEDNTTFGVHYTGSPGRQPEWNTYGDFRWKLTIDKLDSVLTYISKNPNATDSMAKSQAIFKLLQENESALSGSVYIGGSTPNIGDAYSAVVTTLLNQSKSYRTTQWDGKWLFTESNELVAQSSVSKYDLNKALYGNVRLDSALYKILGFKKDAADRLDEAQVDYDKLSDEKKQTFFELELRRRYGISDADLQATYGSEHHAASGAVPDVTPTYEFPSSQVKNWDSLKKHAVEMLAFARPVQYEYLMRRIRTSNPNTARTYLMGNYKVYDAYRYACQMCHGFFPNIESCQIEEHPKDELEPMNVCLCPNCAAKFRELRHNSYLTQQFIKRLQSISQEAIDGSEKVEIEFGSETLWFTQTHIAEIAELFSLKADLPKDAPKPVLSPKPQPVINPTAKPAAHSQSSFSKPLQQKTPPAESPKPVDGMDFTRCVGKKIKHKSEGSGVVKECSGGNITIAFTSGKRAGDTVRYSIDSCVKLKLLELLDRELSLVR